MRRLDKSILEQLYREYAEEIEQYLFVLCRSRRLAEDILQETFLKALLTLPEGHKNIRAWLYIVGRNLLFNEMKKRKCEVLTEEMPHGAEVTGGTGGTGRTEAHISPEDAVLRKEREQELREVIAMMNVKKQEILELVYFEQFTLREAAKIMGLSYENVRVLAHRAKKELRKMIENSEVKR